MDKNVSRIYDQIVAIVENEVKKTSSRDRWGTAQSASVDGVVEVLVDGGEESAPFQTVSTVHVGDRVLLSIDAKSRIGTVKGNYTDPAASDKEFKVVKNIAEEADELLDGVAEAAASADKTLAEIVSDADTANGLVSGMKQAADTAGKTLAQIVSDADSASDTLDGMRQAAQQADTTLTGIFQDAADARTSANQASAHATNALNQLGIVQDVVGVLDYAAKHGTFTRTSDTAIQAGKVYFTYDSQTGDYAPVIDPQASQLSNYYELTYSDDTMGDFIMSHLAVTQRGLWVLPSGMGQASDEQYAPGYKMLLSSGGSYIYDANGALVRSDTASGTDFSSGRRWHVGGDDAYILYTPASGSTPASLTIGGSNIELGDSRTLSQLIAEVDGTLIFKVTEEYSQDETTATLTAHVYKGGVDTASSYPDSCFAWYRKSEHGTSQDAAAPEVPIGNGRTITVSRSAMGFGAAIKCNFTPPNDSVLLDEDDDTLTDSEGTPIAGRTPSGDYVRVADLTATTTVFDTDKLMLVGSEEEQLVSIATLKDVFGDGDYERLDNKPSIEGVELSGDKSFQELGIFQTDNQGYDVPDDYTLSTLDINALWANAQPIGG